MEDRVLAVAVVGVEVHTLTVNVSGLKNERAFGCNGYGGAVSQLKQWAVAGPEYCSGPKC